MKSLIQFRFLLLLSLLIIACSSKKEDTLINKEQPVYFQYNYINWAWGYQHSGWLIDNKGNVNYYNKPADWRNGDQDGISYDDLIYNLSQTDSVIAKIDPLILKEKIKLIKDAIDGEISPETHTAYDAGVWALLAYYYDNNTKKYRTVFLAESGDVSSYNKDTAAIQLTNWLKTIWSISVKQ
jgi:hypothetical protein